MKKSYPSRSFFPDAIFKVINSLVGNQKNKEAKKILESDDLHFIIFRAGGFGDYVLFLDFVNQFVDNYPQASFTIIGGPPLATLNFLIVDRVNIIATPLVNIKKVDTFFRMSTYKELLNIKRQLQINGKRNLFINTMRLETVFGTFKYILFQKLAKACQSFGYNTIDRGRFYTYSIFDSGYLVKHEREYLNDMLNLVKYQYPVGKKIVSSSKVNLWNKSAVTDHETLKVVVHAGGGSNPNDIKWINKRWPVGNYIKLINDLSYKQKIAIYLTGSNAEQTIANEIAKGIDNGIDCFNLTGKTSIADVFEVLKQSHLFIGSDSGISHIAGYLNIPSVIMFAYSDYIGYSPQGTNVTILTSKLECAPCLYEFASRPCLNTNWEFKCIDQLSLPLVKQAVADTIERTYPNKFTHPLK